MLCADFLCYGGWRLLFLATCSPLVVWFCSLQSMGWRCTGWSTCSWTPPWTWQSRPWAQRMGSGAVVHKLGCSAACGILPDQGSNSCIPCIGKRILNLLHHEGSPHCGFNLHFPHGQGEGNGTLLQYSCLENPIDGGAWWAAVHGAAKSWTWLSDFTFTFHFYALEKEMATHSSVLAWRIPGMRSHGVGHDWSYLAVTAWLRILSTFCMLFGCTFCEVSGQIFCPLPNWAVCILIVGSFTHSECEAFVGYIYNKYFLICLCLAYSFYY